MLVHANASMPVWFKNGGICQTCTNHAQHVVLMHFSIALFITAVTHIGMLQKIEDRRNDGPAELDRSGPATGSEVVLKIRNR